MKHAAHVVAGSEHLAQVARTITDRVSVFPTVVPCTTWTPRVNLRGAGVPVIGWIGTFGTARYLNLVLPALRRLRAEGRQFRVRIVGAGPDFDPQLEHERVTWSLEREVENFRELDIGLAPVADDEWGRGKCAFKQVQYFATGVACVTSPIGPAKGFAELGAALGARNQQEWYSALTRLLDDAQLRRQLAKTARELVEHRLCTEIQGPNLAALFGEVIEQKRSR
ncbi:MAG: glycosyltransferase [Deltaproteobacteria bacterium]